MRRRLFSRRVRQTAPRCLRERRLRCLGENGCRGKEQGPSVIAVRRIDHVRHAARRARRHAGRGCFHAGRGKTCFCGNLLLCVGCSHAGRGKTGRLAEGRRFLGEIGADVGRNDGFGGQAASEVGQGVSGKPRQRAAVCNCNSKEGSAGDTPEKARPGVCRVSRSLFFPRAGNADARTRKRRFPRRERRSATPGIDS